MTITILQPDELCPAERVGAWLDACGAATRTVELWHEPLPPASEWGDGAIILGGQMSALDYDEHPWIAQLEVNIRKACDAGTPILGICLGHQILAHALGGTVSVGDALGGEDGVYPIQADSMAADDPVFAHLYTFANSNDSEAEFFAYESHRDAVTRLPEGAVRLASSSLYMNQAFRLGSAVGVQFHPEATPELMAVWRENLGESTDGLVPSLRAVDARVYAAGNALISGFAATCMAQPLVNA